MIQPGLDPAPIAAREAADDQTLVERIRNKLALVVPDPRTIEVKVRGGIVTLSGQLRDSSQRRAAAIITHQVDGVTNVVNKLTLGNEWAFHGALLRTPAPRRAKPAPARKRAPQANGDAGAP